MHDPGVLVEIEPARCDFHSNNSLKCRIQASSALTHHNVLSSVSKALEAIQYPRFLREVAVVGKTGVWEGSVSVLADNFYTFY